MHLAIDQMINQFIAENTLPKHDIWSAPEAAQEKHLEAIEAKMNARFDKERKSKLVAS